MLLNVTPSNLAKITKQVILYHKHMQTTYMSSCINAVITFSNKFCILKTLHTCNKLRTHSCCYNYFFICQVLVPLVEIVFGTYLLQILGIKGLRWYVLSKILTSSNKMHLLPYQTSAKYSSLYTAGPQQLAYMICQQPLGAYLTTRGSLVYTTFFLWSHPPTSQIYTYY